ncbi:quercetin 2,3-dioxygenase [Coraliomargarita sinensis]|uniref:Quercetin 2,3-dioxygenase n=1 Tax=Coraliomargarita sinensis TaxID=2174842 RepID=A0A317ZIH7_9BACT|nr:pirin family protein [Coraliomargarita sinensis]PXA05386.1 quercetin 2,3-dioxygenase [Coraliomargarita sinensis]
MNNPIKQLTRSAERMHTRIDWLDSRHSFSFGSHYDPERMGFGPLRVVNDDRVAPGGGFPPHPHRDMEIVSIVLEGELEHRDSLGNGGIIQAGELQYMSAGSGVRHSEFNPSKDKPVHFLQIWIEPSAKGLEPRYADQPIIGEQVNQWRLILSSDGRDGAMAIRQDLELRTVQLTAGASIKYRPASVDRGLWLFVLAGKITVAAEALSEGDSLALTGLDKLELRQSGQDVSKILLFDLPITSG